MNTDLEKQYTIYEQGLLPNIVEAEYINAEFREFLNISENLKHIFKIKGCPNISDKQIELLNKTNFFMINLYCYVNWTKILNKCEKNGPQVLELCSKICNALEKKYPEVTENYYKGKLFFRGEEALNFEN